VKKRLRILAGPNGSGKSTLFEALSRKYKVGYFINADLIQKILETQGLIDLEDYNIKTDENDFESFCKTGNAISLIQKSIKEGHTIDVKIKDNFIVDSSKKTHSYEGALIASFLREKLIKSGQNYSFETVMSHVSKLDDILEAKQNGYKTYFYFICIDDPEVNVSRVENRVAKGGHNVDSSKIISRYPDTLKNLFPAIEICDKTYLFDNSGEEGFVLIAEIEKGQRLTLHVDEPMFPKWFKEYVLQKFG